MYGISIKREALKELRSFPKKAVESISESIDRLSIDPRPKGCKKLKPEAADLWRIRVGNYRVIYQVDDEIRIVEVRKIGHRKDIYKP